MPNNLKLERFCFELKQVIQVPKSLSKTGLIIIVGLEDGRNRNALQPGIDRYNDLIYHYKIFDATRVVQKIQETKIIQQCDLLSHIGYKICENCNGNANVENTCNKCQKGVVYAPA